MNENNEQSSSSPTSSTETPNPHIETPLEEEKNILEGGILIHGFKGNLNDINPYQRVMERLNNIILSGEIVSPSQRELDEDELKRLQLDASFDSNRVCFHVWNSDSNENQLSYVLNSFFAMPTTAMAGFVPSEDPAFGGNVVALYKNEGVRIPLEKGLLFLSTDMYRSLIPSIQKKAEISGISYDDYVKQHIVILPSESFHDSDILWKEVSARIDPASNVKTRMSKTSSNTNINFIDFTQSLRNIEPSKTDELGETTMKTGNPISESLTDSLEERYHEDITELRNKYSKIEDDPYYLEELRDPNIWLRSINEDRQIIDQLGTDQQTTDSLNKLDDQFKDMCAAQLELSLSIIKQKHPDAPIKTEADLKKHRLPSLSPEVYRDENGEYHHTDRDKLFNS